MSNKLLSTYILIILLIPVTFLLWYGEVIINEKAILGYSVFSFLDSNNIVSETDLSALSFRIENLEEKKIEYTISAFLNDKHLFTQEILVPKRDKVIVKTNKEETIENALGENFNEYLVSIEWKDEGIENKEVLSKTFKVSHEKN